MATYKLTTPISEEDIRKLKSGDEVFVSGKIVTGRDAVHKFLHDGGKCPIDLTGGIVYHCGPVIIEENKKYVVKAAGPTTSIREEPYQADVIKNLKLSAVIGKGGMGKKTLQACKDYGAVYLHAIGGAAQIYAAIVNEVKEAYLMEFGSPEAMWVLDVKDFPCVVTMDTHGDSLHETVGKDSLDRILKHLK